MELALGNVRQGNSTIYNGATAYGDAVMLVWAVMVQNISSTTERKWKARWILKAARREKNGEKRWRTKGANERRKKEGERRATKNKWVEKKVGLLVEKDEYIVGNGWLRFIKDEWLRLKVKKWLKNVRLKVEGIEPST